MDNQKSKNWVTEGVIIALVPFLGYLFTFAYESGYALFFKFPKEYINVGLPQIINAIVILWVTLVLLFFCIEGISFLFFKNKRTLFHSIIRFLPLLGFSIGNFIVYGWLRAAPFIGLVLMLGFSEFIFPLINQRDKKSYNDKLQAYDEYDWKFREDRGAFSARLVKIFGHKNIMLVINLFICVQLTQMVGEISASKTIRFFVTSGKPEKAVLRIYGDNLICAEFNREMKTINKDISVYDLTDPEVKNLKLETIGPLKFADNNTK